MEINQKLLQPREVKKFSELVIGDTFIVVDEKLKEYYGGLYLKIHPVYDGGNEAIVRYNSVNLEVNNITYIPSDAEVEVKPLELIEKE